MRKKIFFIFLSFLLPVSTFAFTVPARPTGFVADYAHILTTDQVTALEAKLEGFERQTTNEIAVVTIPSLDGDTMENVAQTIFTQWGIGKKDTNNGVLLLISLADHKTRIQTGYGVEGTLTDIGTSYIQSDIMTPAFKQGDYNGGINGAVDKMIEALGGSDIVPEGYTSNSGNNSSNVNWSFVVFIGFVVIQWLAAILGRSKSWWAGGVLGAIIGAAVWIFRIVAVSLLFHILITIALAGLGLLFDFFVSRSYVAGQRSGRVIPWWFGGGGFGGGRGGGGGFGGFGGGGSGGGGSGGSW